MKVAFLLALATTKRVGELQAISEHVALHGQGFSISWLPEFVAKTESERIPLPHSFLVCSLLDLVGGLPEECVLCPIRAVCIYLDLTKDLSPRPRSLFVFPRHPWRSILKNSFYRFHIPGICGRWSLHGEFIISLCSQHLWCRCFSCVFAKLVDRQGAWGGNLEVESGFRFFFYFRDLTYSFDGCHSLVPFVTASSVLAP